MDKVALFDLVLIICWLDFYPYDTGDVIEVIDNADKDWWDGCLNGKSGSFPQVYTIPKLASPATAQVLEKVDGEKDNELACNGASPHIVSRFIILCLCRHGTTTSNISLVALKWDSLLCFSYCRACRSGGHDPSYWI